MSFRFLKTIFLSSITVLLLQTAFAAKANPTQSISYTDVGAGMPLVLIHAFPTDKRLWEPQVAELKKSFRVITLDLWGFGLSGQVSGQAVTIAEYAEEVKQLLEQLHIQKALIGGESMGGYVALSFLEKYPERVAGLVLSDTQSIADTPEAKTKREVTAQDVLAHGSAEFIQGFMPKALSPSAPADVKQRLQNILASESPEAIASALRGMALRTDTSTVLANTRLPILIITGEQDALISPQQSQAMHALAKNSKWVVIPEAGHLSNVEQPARWNQAVMAMFLATK